MSTIKDVSEIMNISESRNTPNKLAYKYIIKQVDELLRIRAKDQHYDAEFQVPAVLMYKPNFDRELLVYKIVNHYGKIGFKCFSEGFQVTIRWGKLAQSESEGSDSDSDSDSSEKDSGLYKSALKLTKEESSDEEKLPTRNIVVQGSAPSLKQRVQKMKKTSSKSTSNPYKK